MKRPIFPKIFLCALPVLFGIHPAFAGAASTELWSQPSYTEQWSQPTYTEQWSAEPAQPATPKHPAASSLYIRLQIDSSKAVIQQDEQRLDTPPTVINGRTMVPFRFLGEALRAEVAWDDKNQRITLSLQGKTIILTVNHSTALVNGREVALDAPPVLSGGRALVPLRFVGENLDLMVTHTAATNTIEIRSHSSGMEAAAPPSIPQPAPQADPGPEADLQPVNDVEELYGTWQIWTPGGATNLYYKDTGDYATHIYDQGAEQGTVIIRSDGTFTMKYALWGDAEGEWRLSHPGEINGERVLAIVLQQGSGGYDWAVAPSDNGKIRLLYSWGTWADGSSSWSFDSELYQ